MNLCKKFSVFQPESFLDYTSHSFLPSYPLGSLPQFNFFVCHADRIAKETINFGGDRCQKYPNFNKIGGLKRKQIPVMSIYTKSLSSPMMSIYLKKPLQLRFQLRPIQTFHHLLLLNNCPRSILTKLWPASINWPIKPFMKVIPG